MTGRQLVKTSTTFGAVAAILAACIGVSVANRRAPQTVPGGARPGAIAQNPAIAQSAVLPLAAVRTPKDFGEAAFAHVRALCALGQRDPGTPGWTQQLDYIEAQLRGCGLAAVRDTWTDEKEKITFTNLSVVIPGKRDERIVLACHHDTKRMSGHPEPEHNFAFVGANDGASGVAVLLALAPILVATPHDATIELVFFDGEESLDWAWNDAARALFGSKRYVKRQRDAELLGEAPRIAAMILLDMVGRTDLHIQEELYSTEGLRKILWSAAVACGHQEHVFRRAEAAADDHKPFLEVGIPAVDLIDLNGNPHWHKPTDTIDNMSPRSLQITGDLVLTMLPEVVRTYAGKRD